MDEEFLELVAPAIVSQDETMPVTGADLETPPVLNVFGAPPNPSAAAAPYDEATPADAARLEQKDEEAELAAALAMFLMTPPHQPPLPAPKRAQTQRRRQDQSECP
jgi:hypothetical protein